MLEKHFPIFMPIKLNYKYALNLKVGNGSERTTIIIYYLNDKNLLN